MESVETRTDPWAHAVVESFLPRECFERLRASAEQAAFAAWTSSSHRFAAPLQEVDAEAHALLCGPAATRRLCEHFASELLARGVDPVAVAARGAWEAVVCNDRAGYSIAPHVDSPHKAVTTLLYLAPDDVDDPALGTAVYRGRARDSIAGATGYCGNRWMAFVPGSDTWHGVEPVPRDRERLLVNATLYREGLAPPRGGSWFRGAESARKAR